MVVLLKPESKQPNPVTSKTSESLAIKCEGDSGFEVQNVIDNIVDLERVKNKTPRDILEKVTLIVAMIISILSAFSTFVCVTLMSKRLYHIFNYYTLSSEVDFENRFYISTYLMAVTYSTVSFIFSIVLLKGIKTRKSTFVLAYFVYGIINFTFAVAIVLSVNTIKNSKILASMKMSPAAVCFIISCMMTYGIFLFAVWTVYEKYVQKELSQAEAKRMEPYTFPLKFSKASKTMTA